MATDDPYEILGVPRDASAAEIKSAYRELAMRHHPDRNPGEEDAAETFKRVSWAYRVLSDPKKRRRYRRGGLSDIGDSLSPGDLSFRRAVEVFSEVVDLVGAVFGEVAETGPRPLRGDDLEASVAITLEEVAQGPTKMVEVPAVRRCRRCGGDGSAEGASLEQCSACGGEGRRREGFFSPPTRCPQCDGTGEIPAEACRTCSGTGRESHRREVRIAIPAGVRDGHRIARAGEGAPGRFGGSSGDLFVEIEVPDDGPFVREDDDVHSEASISHTVAALGGRTRVETVDGDVFMQIPAGTSAGDRFRLRGRGLPNPRTGRRGDHYATVRIETPVHLTERQRSRVEARQTETDEGRSFGDRLRRLFSGAG